MAAEQPVLALLGPTASGKSALALALAERLPIEIISVDSSMVYRGMDIGTAKPDRQQLCLVPHHLIDICDPAQPFSAAQFVQESEVLVTAITRRNHIPVLAGGTMMYFQMLRQGMTTLPQADMQLRRAMEALAEQSGWPELHQQLQKVDPPTAARLNPNDRQRIQRALEVYQLTGRALSDWHSGSMRSGASGLPWPNPTLWLALIPENRSWLHQRIEERLCLMWQQGLLKEAQFLHQRGDLHIQLPAMRSVGYKQAWMHLDGILSVEEMQQQALYATRQLAKRQLTWLRHFNSLLMCDPQHYSVQEIAEELELMVKRAQNDEGVFLSEWTSGSGCLFAPR